MRTKLRYLLLIMVTAFAAACHEFVEPENNGVLDDSRLISVNVSQVQTKVIDNDEDILDQTFIVYIYVDGNDSEFQNPYNLVYVSEQGRWRFQKDGNDVDLYWKETGEHQFYAYNDVEYEVSGSGSNSPSYEWNSGEPIINLGSINFTDGGNYQNFDLIYCKTSRDVKNDGYGKIEFPFKHAFASLLLDIENGYPGDVSVTAVSLHGLKFTSAPDIPLDFSSGIAAQYSANEQYDGDAVTLSAGETEAAFGGSILFFPQTFMNTDPYVELTINNVSQKRVYLNVGTNSLGFETIKGGVKYHNTITLTPMNLTLTITDLERYYDGSVIKSRLKLNLEADKVLSQISDLKITINNGSNSFGPYTISAVIPNDVTAVEGVEVEGVVDMPKERDYTITYTFKDGINYEYTASIDYTSYADEPQKIENNYIYSDGSQGNDATRNDIVGVIIYHGNPQEKFSDPDLPDQYCNGLAISVASKSVNFHNEALSVNDTDLVMRSKPTDQYSIGGYTIKKKWDSIANLSLYTTNYGVLPSNTSGWYHGTPKEWDYIFDNLEDINKKLEAAGKETINLTKSNACLLPLLYDSQQVWTVYYSYGFYAAQAYWKYNTNYYANNARPIFAF